MGDQFFIQSKISPHYNSWETETTAATLETAREMILAYQKVTNGNYRIVLIRPEVVYQTGAPIMHNDISL